MTVAKSNPCFLSVRPQLERKKLVANAIRQNISRMPLLVVNFPYSRV